MNLDDVEKVIALHSKDGADGRRIFLPHSLCQSTLFAVAKKTDSGFLLGDGSYFRRDPGGVLLKYTNSFGDTVTVTAPRMLYCSPDLPIFVSVVALMQKHGIHEYSLRGKTSPVFFSKFPAHELYELMKVSSHHASRLRDGIQIIGNTNVFVEYNNPENHGQHVKWSSGPFWSFESISRKGRAGNTLEFLLNSFIVPREHYLYSDAMVLNGLSLDVSRGIYWALICRQHLRGTVPEWQKVLLAPDANTLRWEKKRLVPALEELRSVGFMWSCDSSVYTVTRPHVLPKKDLWKKTR